MVATLPNKTLTINNGLIYRGNIFTNNGLSKIADDSVVVTKN